MELHTSENDQIKSEKKTHPARGHIWRDIIFVLAGAVFIFLIFGSQYATGEFDIGVKVEQSGKIGPREAVGIDFSSPVVSSAVEKNFKIYPEADVSFEWSNKNRKLEIKPNKPFVSGTEYIIEIKPDAPFSVNRILKRGKDPVIITFSVQEIPKVVSTSPISGSPFVKIDSKIQIEFDKSTRGYDVNFEVNPSCDCELEYDGQRKSFTLSPKDNLKWSTDYSLSVKEAVSGEVKDEKDLPEVFRANFKTENEPPPPSVKEVILPEGGVAVSSEPVEAKIKEGKYIDINLAKQQLSIFEEGKRLDTYKVSSGKRGMATPTGTFKILSKSGRAYSKKYNLYMPYWMAFTGAGHGIHELPEWKNGYKEGANHLGIPVSHGCVRLGVGPAKTVFNWAEKGTPVVIHY